MNARYGEGIANDMLDELGRAASKFGPMAIRFIKDLELE